MPTKFVVAVAFISLVFLTLRANDAQEIEKARVSPLPKGTLIHEGLLKPRPADGDVPSPSDVPAQDDLDAQLQKLLTGARMKGSFTTDGKPLTELQPDGYEIKKVQKLKPDGDLWAIHASIQYDGRNLVVPVPVRIQWAGSTPVLVLDNMMVPGFGTFSARVVFHGTRYAGTWQHDSVGGHLFGTIEYDAPNSEKAAEPESAQASSNSKPEEAKTGSETPGSSGQPD